MFTLSRKNFIFLGVFWVVVFGVSLYFLLEIFAGTTNNGVLNYGRQTDTGMNFVRTYSAPSTINTEYADTDSSASAIQFIKSFSAPTREEKLIVHLKADGSLNVLTCTTDCNAAGDWTSQATTTGVTTAGNSDERAFDIAYEQLSGRAMVVFADDPDTNAAYYCLWDGTSWTPATECNGGTFLSTTNNDIPFTDTGVPRWIRLVAYGDRLTDSRSDEMLLAVSGDSGFEVARWTGSTWTNITNISTAALGATTQSAMDIAWESVSGNGLVVFDLASGTAGVASFRKYVAGSGWGGSDSNGPDTGNGVNRWIELASDPMSNRISMVIGDSEDDANVYMWKGDGSTVGFTGTGQVDAMIEPTTGKDVATAWSRFNSRAIFSYTDSGDLDQDVVCYVPDTFGSVNADRGGSARDDVDNVIYIGSPNNADVFYMKGDIFPHLTGGIWDGGGCASGNFTDLTVDNSANWATDLSITADNSAPIEFWFSYDPYSPWGRNWRFYDDETVDTPLVGLNGAAENATATLVDAEEFIRLRMQFIERGGEAQTDTRKRLQYTTGCEPNSSETACTWTDVGDTASTTAVWRYASNTADGASICGACDDNAVATTTSLTNSGQAGTYITAKSTTPTYYFDVSDAGPTDPQSVWNNDSLAFNGITGGQDGARATVTGSTSSNFLQGDGTNAPADNGTIISVRARIFGESSESAVTIQAAIYTDGLGQFLGQPSASVSGAGGWGSYSSLGNPTGGWTWAKVQALETKIFLTAVTGSAFADRVEVEVTTEVTNMDHNALAIVEYDYPLKAENVANSTTYFFRAWDNEQQSRVYRFHATTTACLSSSCYYPALTTSAPPANNAPTVAGVVLKKTDNSTPIVLIENTTTSVSVVGIITDLDGDADITSATATIYLTSVTNAEACTASDINCYTITSGNCALEATDGDNDRAVTCTTALWFLAERSDDDGETWTGFISTTDGTDFGTGTAIEEVATLQALDVTASIAYGTLTLGATTSVASDILMQITTTGNEAIDVTVQATNDMCDTADCTGNTIPACQQQYSTNTNIEYEDSGDSFAEAIESSSTTARNLNLESVTPTTHGGDTSDEADDVFWKIGIPSGQAFATYNGTTTITSKADTSVSDIGDIAQCN